MEFKRSRYGNRTVNNCEVRVWQQNSDSPAGQQGNCFSTTEIREMDSVPDKYGEVGGDIRLKNVPSISATEGKSHRQLVPNSSRIRLKYPSFHC